jgi:hypothetical protein
LIAIKDLLRCRSLTNTAIFSSSASSSGQALDAAISVSGLLLDAGKLHPALSNSLASLAAQAYVSGSSQPLEQVLLDVMSLGQRLSWDQLCDSLKRVEDSRTLGTLAYMARNADKRLPTLFAAISLSGAPASVVRYLLDYSRTGYEDLGAVLHFRTGGINELLQSGLRLYHSSLSGRVWVADPGVALGDGILDACWHSPRVALACKWFLYLFGGFLLATAVHFARPTATALEKPLEVRGFHFARELLFALGFLLVVLLLSEPFLAQESQKAEFHFQLRLPGVGTAVAAGHPDAKSPFMNQMSLLTILLFFVLQGLIYTACLVKLAEIRRQQVPSRVKLRLLENEDHLFDAGLYLGFVGTIISLILVSLGVIKQPSLMAAYSSTSFGIIFVSVFKIFHLRPERRRLLLETESSSLQPRVAATPGFATIS